MLEAARLIFKNMGIPLPSGTMEEAATVLATNDYMGWRKCTAKEAQTCANDGTAAMAVKGNEIYIVKAESDGKDEVATAHSADGDMVSIPSQLADQEDVQFYSYSAATTVNKEQVTLFYDKKEGYVKVHFESSGKTWHCINRDLIYDDSAPSNLYDRTRYNSYVNGLYGEFQFYSVEEMKLLYAIDPHGYAYYTKHYAERAIVDTSLEGIIAYKDINFKILFGREPKYFRLNDNGQWVETKDKSNLWVVYSESELLFGMHAYNGNKDLLDILLSYRSLIFGKLLSLWFPTAGAIYQIIKMYTSYAAIGLKFLQGEFASCGEDLFNKYINSTNIGWVVDLVNFVGDINTIHNCYALTDGYSEKIVEYCTNRNTFHVVVQLANGKRYSLQEIYNAIANKS